MANNTAIKRTSRMTHLEQQLAHQPDDTPRTATRDSRIHKLTTRF